MILIHHQQVYDQFLTQSQNDDDEVVSEPEQVSQVEHDGAWRILGYGLVNKGRMTENGHKDKIKNAFFRNGDWTMPFW